MHKKTRLVCAIALPLLICGCQSSSTLRIQPVGCSLPTGASASGVVHGGARARLAPAHAQRTVAITDAGGQGLIALAVCQSYIRETISQ